jgi:hypothetical protein
MRREYAIKRVAMQLDKTTGEQGAVKRLIGDGARQDFLATGLVIAQY